MTIFVKLYTNSILYILDLHGNKRTNIYHLIKKWFVNHLFEVYIMYIM